MAVGDVVSGISGNNAALTFQPAAGVECLITIVTGGFNGGISNGLVSSSNMFVNANQGNIKLFVNNTNYLVIGAGGAGFYGAYTGIQIK